MVHPAPAPAAGTTTQAAAATPPSSPPKPRPDYSHLDVSELLVQPFGDGDVAHGEKLKLSDALSPDTFLVLDGARIDSVGDVRHSFDVGIGINTDGDSVSDFYATLSWTGAGFRLTVGRGEHGHGYAPPGGIRGVSMVSLEMDAEVRYDNNPVLHGHTAGSLGLLYEFHQGLRLGLTIGTNAMENG